MGEDDFTEFIIVSILIKNHATDSGLNKKLKDWAQNDNMSDRVCMTIRMNDGKI